MARLPDTIRGRTLVLVGAGVLLLQLATFVIFFIHLVAPNLDREADGFVDELYHFVEEGGWGEHPAHRSFYYPPEGPQQLRPASWKIPFWYLVESRLQRRSDYPVVIQEPVVAEELHRYWVDLPVASSGGVVRVGFSAERRGCIDPVVLLLVLLLVAGLTLLTVYLLSSWLVRPIDELQLAVDELEVGGYPQPLPEQGPRELVVLAQRFNHMVASIERLIDNRSTLLAGISHDLKTPLARIRLGIELMGDEREPELVAGIVEDLDEMDGMITEVLEYVRAENHPSPVPVELGGEVVDRHLRGGEGAISWTPPSTPCYRTVDPAAVSRILGNYLHNGLRYGGGTVVVELRCAGKSVRLEVLDRGEGVPEEDMERVFEPFYRGDGSRSIVKGSGLGLAIVQNLATLHRWRVGLRNRPGGGVVAWLEIEPAAISMGSDG